MDEKKQKLQEYNKKWREEHPVNLTLYKAKRRKSPTVEDAEVLLLPIDQKINKTEKILYELRREMVRTMQALNELKAKRQSIVKELNKGLE